MLNLGQMFWYIENNAYLCTVKQVIADLRSG